jgi:uncharacterized protein (DUF58 family)
VRFRLLALLAWGLIVGSLATLNGALLALALPLVALLAAGLIYGPTPLQFRVTRTLSSDRTRRGMPVDVTLSLANEGSQLEEVLVEDLVPRPLELVDGEARMLTSLSPGETVELTYTVCGERGIFDFHAVRVTASDRLGLFRRQATLPAPGRLFVMPEALRLRRVAIRPRRTLAYAGPVPARQGGSGVEFFGVREYRSGDPQRWINWRVSARHSEALFTNEFEQERITDVGLILDARRRSDVRSDDASLFEHAVQATASLAEAFLSDGNRVGMLIYGGFLEWTFPGYGRVQRERILRALARAETGESMVFDRLDRLPTRYFPAQSQLVMVSPLWKDDLPMLGQLAAQGYRLLIVSPDPIAFERELIGLRPDVELAVRIAYLERWLLLNRLRHAGIRVLDWRVDRPFDRAVHASLGGLAHWFRAIGAESRS